MTNEDKIEIVDIIEYLRQEECSSVEICNDNPDFEGPNSVVEVSDYYSEYISVRFEGDSLLDCLRKAKDRKMKLAPASAT